MASWHMKKILRRGWRGIWKIVRTIWKNPGYAPGSEVLLSITQLETTNLDRQYFYRKSSKFAAEHLALEIIYSFFKLFFWLFLLDSILGQRLLYQRQHGCVVQMDVYRDRIITCAKIPHHKLKSEVSRKG